MVSVIVASVTPFAAAPSPAQATATQATTATGQGVRFHDVLSALNPLQYLPVVGTIYRALTGDVIPEALQRAGSMVVSGLLGGPVGFVLNAASVVLEKITGIDPEKIMMAGLAAIEPVSATPVGPVNVPVANDGPAQAEPVPAETGWTSKELAAYGVQQDASGGLVLGRITGADVLNTMQLDRIGKAAVAYAAVQSLPTRNAVPAV